MAFSQKALAFLAENKMRDSKEWFLAHKSEYEESVLKPMRALVTDLQRPLWEIDDQLIAEPKIGRSISRIYRDTRFTKDKSTFRDVIWCVFLREKSEENGPPAFFFEFSPDKVRWGCGFYRAGTDAMANIRKMVLQGDEAFEEAEKAIERYGFLREGESYKRSKYPGASAKERLWLDRKSISVIKNGTYDLLENPELAVFLGREFLYLKPVYDFFMKARTLSAEQGAAPQTKEETTAVRAKRQKFDW